MLQSEFAEIGLNVKIEMMDTAGQLQYQLRPFPADTGPYLLMIMHGNQAGDAAFTMDQYMLSQGPQSAYGTPEFDKKIRAAEALTGQARQDAFTKLFAEELQQIMQFAYIAHMKGILGKSPRVDYTPTPPPATRCGCRRWRPLRPTAPTGAEPDVLFVRRRMYTSLIPLIIVLLGVFLLARLTGDPTNLYLPESATPTSARRSPTSTDSTSRSSPSWWTTSRAWSISISEHLCAQVNPLPRWHCELSLPRCNSHSPPCCFAIIGAVIVGCWAAYRPNSLADRFSSLLSMTAASIPDFWFAITGVWLFSVLLGVLPTSGVDDGMLSWILPIATLMIRPLGVLTQVVRGAMVSALSAPYVRLARSKGAGDLRVVSHHALRNAAAPALTVAGDLAVGLINGAVVVEAIFGWPGIGKLMIDAILQRDFAVLQAAVLLTAVSIFLLNIIIDACYALLDARVREPAKV